MAQSLLAYTRSQQRGCIQPAGLVTCTRVSHQDSLSAEEKRQRRCNVARVIGCLQSGQVSSEQAAFSTRAGVRKRVMAGLERVPAQEPERSRGGLKCMQRTIDQDKPKGGRP